MAPEAVGSVTLRMTRRIAASPETVFDAWLDPSAVGRWLFATPDGKSETVEIDPRIGGRFRIDERRGDTVAEHFGEYLEIDRPRRLVFRFATDREQAPAVVTVEIAPEDGGCRLTLTHAMDPQWASFADRARQGWTAILDGLDAVLTENRALVVTRLLDAPRALVWRAFTDPAQLPRWWGPRGFSCDTAEIDIRLGGVWRFIMRGPSGMTFPNRLRFETIEPPERLVYLIDDDGVGQHKVFRGTVTLAERDGRTLLTMRSVFDSVATRAAIEGYAKEGGESTIDCLEQHVAAMADGDTTLTLVRRIAAPRALVFRMWAEPEHLGRWCRPKDFTVADGSMDFRPGGAWSSTLRAPDGTDHRVSGVYREIVPGERIVFTHAWTDAAGRRGHETVVTVVLEDWGDGTKMTFRQGPFETVGARDGHAGGWSETLDGLSDYLGAS